MLGVAVAFVLLIVIVCSVVVTGMSSQVKAFDTTPVDAISKATFSSAVIKDAIRKALRNGRKMK